LFDALGLRLDTDFVFELAPEQRLAAGRGESFVPKIRPHTVTQRLLHGTDRGLMPVVTMASSLSATQGSAAAAFPLLVSSDEAFGMVDFFNWAKTNTEARKSPADKPGPLSIAFASELPKPVGAPHGGRAVVVGAASVLIDENWTTESYRGTAVFVEGAVSWLTERPVLDIPDKPLVTAGLRVTNEWLVDCFRYVVLFMPLATILMGVAVHLRRRDRRKYVGKPPNAGEGPR
jgi:hypothetical protein